MGGIDIWITLYLEKLIQSKILCTVQPNFPWTKLSFSWGQKWTNKFFTQKRIENLYLIFQIKPKYCDIFSGNFLPRMPSTLVYRIKVQARVSVQGVKSLGGHFACLCRGFEFYEVKKKIFVIIFQKENGNTLTLLIIFIVKSLRKEQNSTNLLLWPPICQNKHSITPKWFNPLDTNSSFTV